MIGHVNLYGVYIPALLVLMLLAYLLKSLLGVALTRLGFYRRVWHPPLFNLALYLILLGVLSTLFSGVRL